MNDWMNLENRVIIVTGGSSGFGATICRQLTGLGALVINADIQPPKEENCGKYFHCDITRQEDIDNLVETVSQKYGKIYGLVNNAGINKPRLLVDADHPENPIEFTREIYRQIMDIDLEAVFFMTQAVARKMIASGGGVIVNFSSTCGSRGSFGISAYAAAKSGVNSLTKSFALELGKYGIRVVAVTPGIHELTGMNGRHFDEALAYARGTTPDKLNGNYEKSIPLGRPGKLSEVADLVCYLLSDRASYITGTVVNVSGGKTTD